MINYESVARRIMKRLSKRKDEFTKQQFIEEVISLSKSVVAMSDYTLEQYREMISEMAGNYY